MPEYYPRGLPIAKVQKATVTKCTTINRLFRRRIRGFIEKPAHPLGAIFALRWASTRCVISFLPRSPVGGSSLITMADYPLDGTPLPVCPF